MPPSQPKVILSLPLPIVLIILLLLVALVAIGGWLLARRRRPLTAYAPIAAPWFLTVLESTPCGALLTDPSGRITAINNSAGQWIKQTGQPDGLSTLPAPVQALAARVAASGVTERLETTHTPDKSARAWVTATPLGAAGDVLVLIERRADGKNRPTADVHRHLMRTIAHELRTPLTAIVGHSDILASCSIEDEQLWRRSQQFIAHEAERLTRLVEDLLTFSRLDLDAVSLAPINLAIVAEETLSSLWQSAEKRHITLALQSPPGLPRVRGNADRLRQVLVNLVDNGVKYTAAGGRVTVRLTPDQAQQRMRVEVSDTGMGIPAADLPHIFEPLFRSERARRAAPGTGLGLTIARTILAQHGAEIHVQSELGRGATFSFELPIAV